MKCGEFPKKFYPDQRLGYFPVVLTLQKMKTGVQADGLRAVGVADVKLLIFQPETEGSEARLGTQTPGEIGPVIVDGKKRRIGVAAQIPAREPCLGKDIHERNRKRYETHRKG